MPRQPAVYILASRRRGTLYTGVTANLILRVWAHKTELSPGFTSKYNVKRLVYFELFEEIGTAIEREKQIKAGSRRAKIKLIEETNPRWRDLYPEICQ